VVVSGGFVVHGPPPTYKLQLAAVDESFDLVLDEVLLVDPPLPEERRFHVDEPSVGVFLQFIHHRVENVLHPSVLDGVVGTVVVLVYRFQPTDVVMSVRDEVDVDETVLERLTRLKASNEKRTESLTGTHLVAALRGLNRRTRTQVAVNSGQN
jgi:hypothetical protein